MDVRYHLTGEVRTANRRDVAAALRDLVPGGRIEETPAGFQIDAQLDGECARDLNRHADVGAALTMRHAQEEGEKFGTHLGPIVTSS